MTISILMPVYNAQHTLADAVRSIQAQTEADWELVAVDDGSRDGSADLLEQMAQRDPRIRVIRRPHAGIVGALNAGLEACRGDLIARTDADDRLYPRRLQLQKAFMQQHPHIGLVAGLVNYDGDKDLFRGLSLFVDWTNQQQTPEQIYRNRFVESPIIHPTVMFRAQLPRLHGAYRNGDFPEDYELWLRWLEAGVRMAKVPEIVLDWCESEGRLTRTDDRYAVDAFYATKTEYLLRHLKRSQTTRVLVWGAGRVSRKRAERLVEGGVTVDAYIDIDPKKIGQVIHGRPVLSKDQIPPVGEAFILAYVGSRGARTLIEAHLQAQGYLPGRDYLLAA